MLKVQENPSQHEQAEIHPEVTEESGTPPLPVYTEEELKEFARGEMFKMWAMQRRNDVEKLEGMRHNLSTSYALQYKKKFKLFCVRQ